MKKGKILLENKTEINFELFPKYAPETVKNFERLANSGFYNNLTFHRVVPGFVIHGGCPYGTGEGNAGYTIRCEIENNPLKHEFGVLSMANSGRDTGSCQFFITLEPLHRLNGLHTVFGKVVSGMSEVINIKKGDRINKINIWDC